MGSRLRAATAAEGADPDFGAVTGPPPRRKQRREPSPLTAPPAPGSGFSGLRPWPTAAAHVYMPPFLYSVRAEVEVP
ncbi:hypothetical protein EMIHUDRAFT_210711 [Emiliania huxleyi CCMP1516]|uniref:Uncharacterized protein n=2 Tax=Emiliania huxleyi TaxID=2903 RepID=A0A0D3IYK9_EMIH1|nr:hypothetical protein EMIHUDRAFT_210711 [Emiliania huxleyi CCMP1516]EOD16344.1 hypothetical protein EMIHUDRAFT_210711 [Emiliania huxleyi CCMP1516]|eukprot:XP_005768773.1 hypothetical protein EMIHUDRAFT_210711 [Emiliania huxleyi CCMP1516]